MSVIVDLPCVEKLLNDRLRAQTGGMSTLTSILFENSVGNPGWPDALYTLECQPFSAESTDSNARGDTRATLAPDLVGQTAPCWPALKQRVLRYAARRFSLLDSLACSPLRIYPEWACEVMG